VTKVFDGWKNDFCNLLNVVSDTAANHVSQDANFIVREKVSVDTDIFDDHFSMLDVRKDTFDVKNNRALRYDELPAAVFKNDTVVYCLFKLFNYCFGIGKIPQSWGKSIINPIPKSSTSNIYDPMSYTGITITPIVYQIFCSLLNDKLTKQIESDKVLFEGQNGFMKTRSTIDHL
jgi:hypothetical protein